MSNPSNSPRHYHYGADRRRNDTLLTTVQALFGGSVIYRIFAHFMKEPEFEAQVMRFIPKDKLPLIAAGTVACGAIGLLGQRHSSRRVEADLSRALEEMTSEAANLRRENDAIKRHAPGVRISDAAPEATLTPTPVRKK